MSNSLTEGNTTSRFSTFSHASQHEEHLAFILEAAGIAEWEYDFVNDITHRNLRHDMIYGYDHLLEKWTYDTFLSHVLPEYHKLVEEKFSELMSAGTIDFSFKIRRHDGILRWLALKGRTFRDESGRPIKSIGIIQDVTDLQESAIELYRLRQETAEAANSAKSAFLAHMSHELRTPLGAILGFIEILKNPDNTREELYQYIGVIDRNSRLLLKIIDEVLDLSKVEAGKLTIESVVFSLSELLTDFSSLMSYKAREKGLQFELKFVNDIPDTVKGDPTRIRQVLNNAIGNAIKFTDFGYVRLLVAYSQNRLTFSFEDSGKGLTPEEASRLFQPFNQASSSTARMYGGTGLGLALSRKLCENMKGKFYLEKSQPGIGSVFKAEIAIEVPLDSKMINFKTLPFTSSCLYQDNEINALKGLKVLVIDDSIDSRALLKFLLNRWGVVVDMAANGREGLDKALKDKFDVILMDIQMPQMDGYETTKNIRSLDPKVPIVALTAHALSDEKEKCYKSGFTDFLSKPVQKNVLRKQLAQYFLKNQSAH